MTYQYKYLKDITLPSNKKFGFFFSTLFFLVTLFCFLKSHVYLALIFLLIFLTIIFLTLINEKLLSPFNKAWMLLGAILNIIVSPIILGFLFFSILVPTGLIMKIFRRDELKIKYINKNSYWRQRSTKSQISRNQF